MPVQSAHTTPIVHQPLSDLSTLLNCELPPTLLTVSDPLPLQGNSLNYRRHMNESLHNTLHAML